MYNILELFMEVKKSADRRFERTKRAIRGAFEQLVAEKEVNAITISEIAKTADINRKTFYSHYAGIYQLIQEIEDEIVAAFDSKLAKVDFENNKYSTYFVFHLLSEIINRDIDFYVNLASSGHNLTIRSKIISALKLRVKESIIGMTSTDSYKLGIALDFIIAGTIEVYGNRLKSSRNFTVKQLSATVDELIAFGVKGLFGAGNEQAIFKHE